ncbi:MAG TPA: hypothetical protein VFW11_24840 [Cyclobacteriaceae bacterium]|nr:hypothetical protein [Cyclobacteriaceae bacterium]
MSEIDDDNVEKYFRQADPSRFDTDYNENDWRNLESRLDREQERLAALNRRKLTYGIVAGALLVTFIGSFYFFSSGSLSDRIPGKVKESASTDQAPMAGKDLENANETDTREGNVAGEPGRSAQSIDDDNTEEISKKESQDADQRETNRSDHERLITKEKKSENIFDRQATSGKQHDVKTNENAGTTNAEAITPGVISGKGLNDNSDANINGVTEQSSQISSGKENESLTITQENVSSSSVRVDSAEKVQAVILPTDSLEAKGDIEREKGEMEATRSRWMVSAVVAPDFTRTPYSGYDSPGSAYGVFVQYQFHNRWGVSTGLLRSDKKYWGYGEEYNPPPGYWSYVTNGVVPEKVDGNCLVLEVPLSLSFNIVETKRSRVFATAGISSYFMRSEKYQYTFEDPNPGSAKGWSTDKPSSYWFGIGNLSVGYDFRVSPTLSFGLEPYYRIPFAEVGWANIDLYSLGFLFNARYRFVKREHLSSPGILK